LDLTARLGAAIEQLLPTYRDLLQHLVREPSTLGNERPAQLVLWRALRRQGLEPRLYDLDLGLLGRQASFAPTGLSYTGRPNLAASRVGTGGGR
jgi:hypothetical protein